MSKSLNRKHHVNQNLLRKIQAQTGRYLGQPKIQVPKTTTMKLRVYHSNLSNSIDHWLDVLSSGNSGVRLQALKKLTQLGDPKATPAICEVLRNDPDPDVRYFAAKALGQIFE